MVVIKVNYSSVYPVIKITYDDNPIYIKTSVDATYVSVNYSAINGGGSATWGTITGTLSNQTDLQNALNAKVPYSGATANVDLGEYELKAGQIEYDQTPTGVAGVATTRWNDNVGTIETTLKGGNVILKHGRDMFERIVNKTGIQLTKAAYQAVRISTAQGQRLGIALAQANNDNNSADTIGLVVETIDNNQEGIIYTIGEINDINTTGSLQSETWSDGDVLYLSPTIAGRITNVKPVAPQHLVVIGYVVYAHANHGKIYVKIMNGWELGELHDVNTNGATNGQVLRYNGTIWVNDTDYVGTVTSVGLSAPTGFSVSGSPVTSSGILGLSFVTGYSLPTTAKQTEWDTAYTNRITTLTTTGSSGAATLVNNTLNIPNYTLSGLGGVPTSRQLTINGTAFDLSANRSWSVGTVTSVAATAGTGISISGSPITSSGTLTITNTAPDQVVSLTGTGTTSVSGTYPSFTITSNDQYNGTVTSVSVVSANGLAGTVANASTTPAITLSTTVTGILKGNGTGISAAVAGTDYVIPSALNSYLPLAGGTMSGFITLHANPTQALHAVTKQYVDAIAEGLHVHASCEAATPNTLASITGGTVTYNNGTSGVGATLTLSVALNTLDGVTLVNGNRILVKNEANTAHNGIYVRTSSTILTRASDFDTATEIAGGDFVFITGGTLYDNSGWVQTEACNTIGTDPVLFQQFSGAGTYLAGTGLTLTGNTFSANIGTDIQGKLTLTTTGNSGAATLVTNTLNIPTYTLTGLGGFANPMTTLGDIIYGAASGTATRLAGNTTTAKQYLSQTGNGTASAAPSWATIAGSDITGAALTKTDDTNVTLTLGGTPSTALLRAASLTLGWTGQLSIDRGGTGLSALGTANQLLRVNAGGTALEYFTPTYLTAAITSLNGLTAATQTFAVGTSGTDFAINSSTSTHTFNLPTASATNRGALSSADWTTFNSKQGAITLTTTGTSGAATLVGTTLNIPQYQSVLTNPVTGTGTTNYLPKFTGSTTIGDSIFTEVGGNTLRIIAANAAVRLTGSNEYILQTVDADGRFRIYDQTAALERVTLTSGGNVGINTTTIGSRLQVNGGAAIGYSASTTAPTNGLTVSGSVGIGTATVLAENMLQVSRNVNGQNIVSIENANTGTDAYAELQVRNTNVSNSTSLRVMTMGTGYTSVGGFVQNSGVINADINLTGGLSIMTRANAPIRFYTNGHTNERMTLDASGRLGIGTSSPALKGHIVGTAGLPASSGTTQLGALRLQTGTSTVALDFGVNGGTGGWLQVTNANDLSLEYPLIFNPNGGNVGIGTTNPIGTLDVANLTPSLYIRNTKDGSWTSGETVGALNFYTNDVSVIGAHIVSSITSIHDGVSTTTPAGALVFSTAIQGTTVTEAMRITSGGNVGIGSTSPSALLTLQKSALVDFGLYASDQATDEKLWVWQAGSNVGTGIYRLRAVNDGYTNGINALVFKRTGISSLFTYLDSGNFGIGTGATDSGAKLQVSGTSTLTTNGFDTILSMTGNGDGTSTASITNTSVGSSARAELRAVSNTASIYLSASSSTNTSASLGGRASTASIFTPSADTSGGIAILARNASGYITLHSGGNSERMRITSGGNVLVGTTTDSGERLVVSGSGLFTDNLSIVKSGNALLRVHASTNTTPVVDIEMMRGTNTTWGADAYGDYRFRNSAGNLSIDYGDTGVTTTRLTIKSTGQLQLHSYQAANSFTGTYVGLLAFDVSGNILTLNTLNNTRIDPRSITTTSTATLTPDLSVDDFFTVTAQAAAITLANPTGTPVDGQRIIIRIKDNGTARAINYGTQYRGSSDYALPTTTTVNRTIYLGFIYNTTDTKWDLIAKLDNFA